jgi:DNA polymerase III alpha subunit
MSIFGTGPSAPVSSQISLPDVEEFKNAELLKYEKEVLGFYITSHRWPSIRRRSSATVPIRRARR